MVTAWRADRIATSTVVLALAIAAGVAVLASLAWGYVLGFRRMWAHLGISALAGTGLLMLGYVVAMVTTASPQDDSADNAAGVGLVILSVPTLVVIGTLLAAGGGLGTLGKYLRSRA
jgi:hypothetical protein